tara:strand:- start:856 stop:1374 length:519 start_codon:yes stop_codon:yes gene_type:complete
MRLIIFLLFSLNIHALEISRSTDGSTTNSSTIFVEINSRSRVQVDSVIYDDSKESLYIREIGGKNPCKTATEAGINCINEKANQSVVVDIPIDVKFNIGGNRSADISFEVNYSEYKSLNVYKDNVQLGPYDSFNFTDENTESFEIKASIPYSGNLAKENYIGIIEIKLSYIE